MKDIVLVFSEDETAALCVLITEAVMGSMLGILAKPEIDRTTFMLLEAGVNFVGKANEAMGNGDSADLHRLISRLRDRVVPS